MFGDFEVPRNYDCIFIIWVEKCYLYAELLIRVETNKRNMKTQPQIRNIVLEMSGFCLASEMRTDDKK